MPKTPNDDHEIFHDPTGRRWRITKIVAVVLAAGIGFFSAYYIPRVLDTQPVQAPVVTAAVTTAAKTKVNTPSPEALANQLGSVNVPVIGDGPLIRIDHIVKNGNQTLAVEAYNGRTTKVLSDDDKLAVGDHDYAIERYGSGKDKKIALTFDDGPDAVYSPQILDVLAKYQAPSTFFLVGSNVVKNTAIAQRMAREGHAVANHTFDHVNFNLESTFQSTQEINQTSRVIRSATGHAVTFFRPPYGGPNDQAMRDTMRGLLYAQEQGLINASYTFDTKDYEKSTHAPDLPKFDGSNIVMLLHDGGGDRSRTITYLNRLIPAAKAQGYSFTNLDELYGHAAPQSSVAIGSSIEDKMAFVGYTAAKQWPHKIIGGLFILSVFAIILNMVINVVLAILQMRRAKRYSSRPKDYNPLVSILVPAYNEGVVLKTTVDSLLASNYKNIEIVIINDGSTDDTLLQGRKLARAFTNVHCLTQPNGGKSTALNRGIKWAKGEILICIDADTVFPPDAIENMVRHFADPKVGAVAGSVKVGNHVNIITRWQALEYTVGIHLERTAQAFLGAIVVVPGACGAWRKQAIVEAGGFSRSTLAEDCDLTLSIQKAGWLVKQDNSAKGYTEVPQTYRALGKQRFRWIFGNLQAFFKHRDIMFRRRHGWLGMFVMPYALLNILLPFLFIPVVLSLMIENITSGQYLTILFFASITLGIQFIMAFIGITLARERYRLLLAVPLTKLMYSPLKTYVLFRTALTALRGAQVGWNKLLRTGNVTYPKMSDLAGPAPNNTQAET